MKNVGRAAVNHIIGKRNPHGPYTDLSDFALDIDLRMVNRKVFESLILCGALDSTGWNRKQLIEALDRVLEMASRAQADSLKGQGSLFDLLPEEETTINRIEPPEIKEFSRKELLRFEKELMGFYITGHPLDDYKELIKHLGAVENVYYSVSYSQGDGACFTGQFDLLEIMKEMKACNEFKAFHRMLSCGYTDDINIYQ